MKYRIAVLLTSIILNGAIIVFCILTCQDAKESQKRIDKIIEQAKDTTTNHVCVKYSISKLKQP